MVSVIVPTYNRAKIIGETIESVLAQTSPDWELIIVDDHSTDNTAEVVGFYSGSDSRVRYLRRQSETKGAPVCRNEGIQEAKGEFLIFLDSDDILGANCIKNRQAFMRANPDLDFAVFPGLRFKETPGDMHVLIGSTRDPRPIQLFLDYDIPWGNLNPIWQKSAVLSHELMWAEKLRGFQDIQFHFDAIAKGLSFKYAETVPDCYWRSPGDDNLGKSIFNPRNLKSHTRLISHLFLRSRKLSQRDRSLKKSYDLTNFSLVLINMCVGAAQSDVFIPMQTLFLIKKISSARMIGNQSLPCGTWLFLVVLKFGSEKRIRLIRDRLYHWLWPKIKTRLPSPRPKRSFLCNSIKK